MPGPILLLGDSIVNADRRSSADGDGDGWPLIAEAWLDFPRWGASSEGS